MASNSDFKKGPGTFKEEASAFGERVKGAVKEGAGKLTGNERLEREGRTENAEGNMRQAQNDVFRDDGTRRRDEGGWRDPMYSERTTDPIGSSTLGQTFDRATGASGSTYKSDVSDRTGYSSDVTGRTDYSSDASSRSVSGSESYSSDMAGRSSYEGAASSTATSGRSTGMLADRCTVSGIFRDRAQAEQAWRELKDRFGLKEKDINVLMSDETRKRFYGDAKPGKEFNAEDTKTLEGLGVGSALGGTLGAIVGAIAAIGTNLIIPGAGLVIAGPLAAAFAGAGLGGVTGGLVGALVGAGIPEEHAQEYERAVRSGAVVLSAQARDQKTAQEIESYLRSLGAQVHTY